MGDATVWTLSIETELRVSLDEGTALELSGSRQRGIVVTLANDMEELVNLFNGEVDRQDFPAVADVIR